MSESSSDSRAAAAAAEVREGRARRRRMFRLRRHSSPGSQRQQQMQQQLQQEQEHQQQQQQQQPSAAEALLQSELYVIRRKLVSKCEALGVLCRELECVRQDRDDYKQQLQQAHERCNILRRVLGFGDLLQQQMQPVLQDADHNVVSQLLFECIEHNKALQQHNAELQESLHNAHGDMKALRDSFHQLQQLQQQQQQQQAALGAVAADSSNTLHVEQLQVKVDQLQRDIRQLIDDKEELVMERDVLKGKYERLNSELHFILKGDAGKVLDIDALVNENHYLQQRISHMQEERMMAYQAVSKYKSMLHRRQSAAMDAITCSSTNINSSTSHNYSSSIKDKAGVSRSVELHAPAMTQKELQALISDLNPTPKTLRDLQQVAKALLDTIHDKNLALTHQRKANKLLAERVAELEKQVNSMDSSGYWRNASSVLRARSLHDVRNLFPDRVCSVESCNSSDSELDRWPCRDQNG